jgi:hypothetical protein
MAMRPDIIPNERRIEQYAILLAAILLAKILLVAVLHAKISLITVLHAIILHAKISLVAVLHVGFFSGHFSNSFPLAIARIFFSRFSNRTLLRLFF